MAISCTASCTRWMVGNSQSAPSNNGWAARMAGAFRVMMLMRCSSDITSPARAGEAGKGEVCHTSRPHPILSRAAGEEVWKSCRLCVFLCALASEQLTEDRIDVAAVAHLAHRHRCAVPNDRRVCLPQIRVAPDEAGREVFGVAPDLQIRIVLAHRQDGI